MYFQSKSALSDALALASKGEITVKNAIDVGLSMDEAVSQSKKAVHEVTNLAQSLQEGAGPQIDSALNEAQTLLDGIKNSLPSIAEQNDEALASLEKFDELRSKMAQNVSPIDTVNRSLKSLKNKTQTFKDDILDIKKYTDIVRDKADQTKLLNNANRFNKIY